MRRPLAMLALLSAMTTAQAAPECIALESTGSSSFIVNRCNTRIGPINFCWESQEAWCSCYRGSGCSAGPLSPGRKEIIPGPGRAQHTRINFSWCVYDNWVKGTCRPRNFR